MPSRSTTPIVVSDDSDVDDFFPRKEASAKCSRKGKERISEKFVKGENGEDLNLDARDALKAALAKLDTEASPATSFELSEWCITADTFNTQSRLPKSLLSLSPCKLYMHLSPPNVVYWSPSYPQGLDVHTHPAAYPPLPQIQSTTNHHIFPSLLLSLQHSETHLTSINSGYVRKV